MVSVSVSVVADQTDGTAFLVGLSATREVTTIWDREWDRKVLRDCLEHVRREVEPTTFTAFQLVVQHGRSATEVAEELGVAVTVVYNAKHRIVKRIRELREQLDQAA